jgi:phospholipase C
LTRATVVELSRMNLLSAAGISLCLLLSGCSAQINRESPSGSAAPVVSIAANPGSINPGNSTTLTVTASNATQVVVTGTDGSTYDLPSGGGTQTVRPAATTTYTATATGPAGSASATASVTVASATAPTVSITANPTSITAGSSSLLTIIASNSTQVTVTGSDGSKFTLAASGGTQAVSPSATTTYTASATGPGGTASASATVTITANPAPTVTISANPAAIAPGGSTTLTVSATDATQVTIKGSDGSLYTLPSPSGGTQSVSPAATTNYTATATGPGGTSSASATVTVTTSPLPSVSISASPTEILTGNSSTLAVSATNATQVTVTGTDGSSYTLAATGGSQLVTPSSTTTYTATANGAGGTATASVTVTITSATGIVAIDHVIFMLQENHSFDAYFGMLNPYRIANGWNVGADGETYNVDGIDDKLSTISNEDDQGTSYPLFKFTSTCVEDMSSAWLSSYGDVNRYNFLATRPIDMDGFVHAQEGYSNYCSTAPAGTCAGSFPNLTGQPAMGYYDQGFLNYYYFMASQFALDDRWFSPVASYTVNNRIATFTGGSTQGLVYSPGGDHLPQLDINNIFEELDQANVSWKIYYSVTDGYCLDPDDCPDSANAQYPATQFSSLSYSYRYLYENPSGAACVSPTQSSSVVNDPTHSFCIDPNHIAPLSQYYVDLADNALPSFAFIEAGYGQNDEHPGSGQSILMGQAEVAKIVNALMASSEWKDSVFFFGYDEGGGPYDHVPPVPGHSNDNTDASLGTIPDISTIAVNPDSYYPCPPPNGTPTLHCDLHPDDPGTNPDDAPAEQGFAAQLGFRVPNMIISPFTIAHYVSHTPMDHTAVIKFVESRFIGSSAHLTARDAAQPNLLEFFDFTSPPWATPPTPPTPVSAQSLGYNPCTPGSFAP